MRRLALVVVPLLASWAALAGCASSPDGNPAGADPVTVTGSFGKAPAVKIPDAKASGSLEVRTLIAGTGPVLPSTYALLGDYVVYIWNGASHRMVEDTYSTVPALFSGRLLPGLTTALKRARIGSRILAVIPPKYGFGTQGNAQGGVSPGDTLVFVIDIIKAFPKDAAATGKTVSAGGHGLPAVTPGNPPKITIPSGQPPATLTKKTLIAGSGPVVRKGDFVVSQYVGVIWRTGKIFDSSEADGSPFGFTIGATPSQVIPGWNTGLVGEHVGSRVLLVVPPKEGYGSAGSSSAGIKGTDTLVFVIDILGAFPRGTT